MNNIAEILAMVLDDLVNATRLRLDPRVVPITFELTDAAPIGLHLDGADPLFRVGTAHGAVLTIHCTAGLLTRLLTQRDCRVRAEDVFRAVGDLQHLRPIIEALRVTDSVGIRTQH